MKKYIDNVMSLISANPSAFLIIMLIAAGLSLLPDLLLRLFTGGGFNPFSTQLMVSQSMDPSVALSMLGSMIGILFLFLLFTLLISPFIDAGFLSYLDSNKDEENHIQLFINMGFKKYGKALGALLLMILLIIAFGIAAIIVSIPLSFIFMLLGEGGAILVSIIIGIAMLVCVMFLMFMVKDAVIGGIPVGGTIASSFKKVKKVFWPLLGLLILASLIVYALTFFLPGLLATFIGALIGLVAEAYLFYPLYKHATDLTDDIIQPVMEEETTENENTGW